LSLLHYSISTTLKNRPSKRFSRKRGHTNPVLHRIVATKKEEVSRLQGTSFPARKVPVYPWRSQLKKENTVTVIAECKKGSPSAGIIRPDYNPLSISKIYEANGAAAISVLTDKDYFLGSISDLEAVASSVKIPVIRKDFIIDPIQIDEAYSFGASAILLIVRILSKSELTSLYRHATSLGLGVLVETHNAMEVQTALEAGADTIGINTRDLDTFQIHPRLVEEIATTLPDSLVRVAESGIQSFSDWQAYKGIVDCMLIGTYFMKSPDIQIAYTNLMKP